jgi:hypothetical protein
LNEWVHVAVVYDASSVANDARIYLNGVEQSSLVEITPTGTIATDAGISMRMGNYAQDTSRTFDGMIDDVRIYDRVLDAAEVAALAGEAGTGGGGGGGSLSSQVVFESLADANLPSNGTALNVPAPAGTAAGDLLIAAIVTDGEQKPDITAPAGWTLIDHGTESRAVTMDVLWKITGAAEPGSYDFSWVKAEQAYGWIMRFSGHDPSNPINTSAVAGGASSAPVSPAVDTTVANALVLRIGGFDDDSITIGDPGLAGHAAINMNESGTGANSASGGAGYATQAAAGNSGTSTFSLTSSERYRAVTVAIAPAP